MSSYCPICDQFVDNLDHCELPYGGAPAPPGKYEDDLAFESPPVSPRKNEVIDDSEDYDKYPMRKPWCVPFEELLPETRAKYPGNMVKSENHLWEIDLDTPDTGLWRQNAMTTYEPLTPYLILARDFTNQNRLYFLVKVKNHHSGWVNISLDEGDNIYNVRQN